MIFEQTESKDYGVDIRVVGVGGGGNNAVNRMIAKNIQGVDFVTVNTDRQALGRSNAPHQIVIGEKITKGFGAGAKPEIGARAAEESIDELKSMLSGADMVFDNKCFSIFRSDSVWRNEQVRSFALLQR